MARRKIIKRERPEAKIQKALIALLESRGWHVEHTHGSMYQTGMPDLFIGHPGYGQRWIDVKNPERYSFTKAQRIKWPKWEAAGIGIWILTAATQAEYDKLFGPPNWRNYWRDSWAVPESDEVIEAVVRELNDGE